MSQPVALIARVRMTERAFRKFLRSEHADFLVELIANELITTSKAYYAFRFLKSEQALFAFFFFNHGNADLLRRSCEWTIIQQLAIYSDDDRGFALHSLDALNPFDNVITSYQFMDGRCVEKPFAKIQGFDRAEFMKECVKYFFDATDVTFALALKKGLIVDKSIAKRSFAHVESKRIDGLGEKLHEASLKQPIHLFGDYFFNGRYVYHNDVGEVTLLPEIDAASFRPAAWGGTDVRHAVIRDQVLKVDVGSFKMLQRGETEFYKDQSKVFSAHFNDRYDKKLRPMPSADAPSFKMRDEFLAEDSCNFYFCGNIIPRSELGSIRVEPAGYFYDLKLFVGDYAVYLGGQRLALDAVSFRIEQDLPVEGCGIAYVNAYVVSDASGFYLLDRELLWNGRFGSPRLTQVADIVRAQAFVARISQAYRERSKLMCDRPQPTDSDDTNDAVILTAYAKNFERWAENFFDLVYSQDRFDPESAIYREVSYYFHALFHLARPRDVIYFYSKIQHTAWLHPEIFHHTARSYAALSQSEEALEEMRKAFAYRYAKRQMLWQDPNLSTLRRDRRYEILFAQFSDRSDVRPLASMELLDAILTLPPIDGRSACSAIIGYLRSLALGTSFMLSQHETPDAGRVSKLQKIFKFYLNQHLVQNYATRFKIQSAWNQSDFYNTYRVHPFLHPLAHWKRYEEIYRNAHCCADENESKRLLDLAQPIFDIFKTAISAARSAGDPDVIKDIEREYDDNSLFRYIMGRDWCN
ncbi:hypothetical protein ACIGHN_27715 [Acidovorax sp. NPDC077693]|uniref:hypothetical protein n=1 Tax=unclassified Acidovorax TaxID=2684926 RepID=UPI0037CA4058